MAECRDCKQKTRWIRHINGKFMMCNIEMMTTEEKEEHWILYDEEGEPSDEGYLPHWFTCPKAKKKGDRK